MDRNKSRSPLNGRISSGYHSEDDAYVTGRTTPTIEALPGLLSGCDTDSEADSIDPTILRLVICGLANLNYMRIVLICTLRFASRVTVYFDFTFPTLYIRTHSIAAVPWFRKYKLFYILKLS